jgi:hypothetical protein
MADERAKAGTGLAKRAQRFAIELPLRYREKGAADWLEGITVNISASGVLFRSGAVVQPATALEIALVLPVAIPGEAPAEIVCQGTVIRRTSAGDGLDSAALAAAFQHYRIAKGSD